MKGKTNKDKWLHVRLSEEEYNVILKFYKSSTCRKLSEYARIRLQEKPVTRLYRNQSLDDFMAEMMRLRADLNAVGNNFNQSVKRLNMLQNSPSAQTWVSTVKNERDALLEKVERIKSCIETIAKSWLQSSKQDRQ